LSQLNPAKNERPESQVVFPIEIACPPLEKWSVIGDEQRLASELLSLANAAPELPEAQSFEFNRVEDLVLLCMKLATCVLKNLTVKFRADRMSIRR
jgi:hypothetical protein